MHNTAIEMLRDMVNLWTVWHGIYGDELRSKVARWENCGYGEADQSAARQVVLGEI